MRRAKDDAELATRYRSAGALFFDCDGVLFDSNRFKREAIEAVMADYPEATRDPMREYWEAKGGVSRYVKLRHYLADIVGITEEAELERHIQRGLERFGDLSRAGYRRHDPLPEAMRLLGDAGPERCHVVSGTDQAELRAVFADKGLDARVAGVYGSPTGKPAHIEAVLTERGLGPDQALFFGDGGGDYEACRQTGVGFVFLARYSGWRDARQALAGADDAIWAEDLAELLAALGVRG